jgi:hypothetical protein
MFCGMGVSFAAMVAEERQPLKPVAVEGSAASEHHGCPE